MTSAPRGVPIEPSVALLFFAAAVAAWRWLQAGEAPPDDAQTRGDAARKREAPPAAPFRRHRSPTARFAPPRFTPSRDAMHSETLTTVTPPPIVAGRE